MDKDALYKIEDVGVSLSMANDLIEVILSGLLNFGHIDPCSDNPDEKSNAIRFCGNFSRLSTMIILTQTQIAEAQSRIQKLLSAKTGTD